MSRSFDLVLVGGTVIDGLGNQPAAVDVGIKAGRLVALAAGLPTQDCDHLDVTGLVVAPGFLDSHVHSDFAPFLDPGLEVAAASVRQGVTTEISGNCGFSAFPYADGQDSDSSQMIISTLGSHGRTFPSLDAFRDEVSQVGAYANIAMLVGHNSAWADLWPPHSLAADLVHVIQRAHDGLDQGAVGVSSGLIYPPGSLQETNPIIPFAATAGRRGLPYASHIRSEARGVLEAINEAIEIGRRSSSATHISHLKVAGRPFWHLLPEVLGQIDAARSAGLDVTADAYPYTAGSTTVRAMFPPWLEDGGPEKLLEMVADPVIRGRLRASIRTGAPNWPNPVGNDGWENIVISTALETPECQGQDVATLAGSGDPVDLVCDLILANRGAVTVIVHAMSEENVSMVLAQDYVAIGSDAVPEAGRPHPRAAGTFPRWLGHYVRDRGVTDLVSGVRRCTSATADRFGLTDRGRVVIGAMADLVVFNADTIADRATFADPLLRPVGIPHVLVGGALVVRDGELTGQRPGRVIAPTR